MIIKVKASTFIPAGTALVTVALDGHFRPATSGEIEMTYERPIVDEQGRLEPEIYAAVMAGEEFCVSIPDQILHVRMVEACGNCLHPVAAHQHGEDGDICVTLGCMCRTHVTPNCRPPETRVVDRTYKGEA